MKGPAAVGVCVTVNPVTVQETAELSAAPAVAKLIVKTPALKVAGLMVERTNDALQESVGAVARAVNRTETKPEIVTTVAAIVENPEKLTEIAVNVETTLLLKEMEAG